MGFNFGQTFYLDPAAVGGADNIFITDIQLFFSAVPNTTINIAGTLNPGVSVYLALASTNNAPDQGSLILGGFKYLPPSSIVASNTANVATVFTFPSPVPVKTGQFISFLIQFYSPEYQLWTETSGQTLVGSNTISQGPSGKYVGAFYEMGGAAVSGLPTPLVDTDLKFIVDVATFTSNAETIELVNENYEFINYSTISNTFIGGELVYQDFGGFPNGSFSSNVTFYSKGTLNLVVGNNIIKGNGTSFTNAITGFAPNDYILVTDGTVGNIGVVIVNSVSNDTLLTVVGAGPPFANAASFYKKTAFANIYFTDYRHSTIILDNSTSNVLSQFSNSSIQTFIINAGGNTYNNSDYIHVTGGSINAFANISTNSTGGIISINITNSGLGFGSSNLSILASNGSTSNGSGANISLYIGSTIRGLASFSTFILESFYDYHINSFVPSVVVQLPDVATVNTSINFANVGQYVNASNEYEITMNQYTPSLFDSVIMSRVNEVNTPNSHLANVDGDYKSAYIKLDLIVDASNTLLFTSPYVFQDKLDVVTFRIDINNDDSGETGNFGNCISKGITETLTFANNNLANTARFYTAIYQPIGTTIEVYMKVINPNDPDSFLSKAWTPLAIISGAGTYSSSVDLNDFIQYTFGVPPYPKSLFTCPGIATVANTGNVVILTTSNLVSNLASGDLIKIYNPVPEFSNGEYFLTVVSSVNSSSVTVTSGTTNNSVSGVGFAIDKIDPAYKNTVFADPQNYGIATYYNNEMSQFNQFSTMAFKILFLFQM